MKKIILLISSIVIVAAAVICAVVLFVLPGKDDDSSTDVSIELKGNVKFKLSDDVGEIIKKLNDFDYYVIDVRRGMFLDCDDNDNIFIQSNLGNALKNDIEDRSYIIYLQPMIYNKNISDTVIIDDKYNQGELLISFQGDRESGSSKIQRISLFDGWNGDFEDLEKYFNDENSTGSDQQFPVLVFKNNKIIPISELLTNYGTKADDIINNYESIIEYYQAQGMSQAEALGYFRGGAIGNLTSLGGLKNENLKRINYCMCLAMAEWYSLGEKNGINNYGVVKWEKNIKTLDFYIPYKSSELARIEKASKGDK